MPGVGGVGAAHRRYGLKRPKVFLVRSTLKTILSDKLNIEKQNIPRLTHSKYHLIKQEVRYQNDATCNCMNCSLYAFYRIVYEYCCVESIATVY